MGKTTRKKNYTAEQGLVFLSYLNLDSAFTYSDRHVFKVNWKQVYDNSNGDFLRTVRKLYTKTVPHVCGEPIYLQKGKQRIGRKELFERSLADSGVAKKLEEKVTIDEILREAALGFVNGNGEHRRRRSLIRK